MNKKISFPITIAIIVVCAVLTGLVVWKYGLIPGIGPSGPLPKPPEKEVTITTDKTEYEQEEEVKIEITNPLLKSIWLPIFYSPDVNCLVEVETFIDGKWKTVATEDFERDYLDPKFIKYQDFIELKPQEKISRIAWDQQVRLFGERVLVSSGEYRILFNYYTVDPKAEKNPDILKESFKQIYSNKFKIKQLEIIEGAIIKFGGSSFVRAPQTEAQLYITVAHGCEVEDELILQKVEIGGEDGKVVKSFEVNSELKAIGKEIKEAELKMKELDTIEGQLKLKEEIEERGQEEYLSFLGALALLSEEMRENSFQTGYFIVDLKQLRESLEIEDKVPVVANITIIHNGRSVTLTKTLIVEYRSSLP